MSKEITIIGYGFVGKAIAQSMKPEVVVNIIDPAYKDSVNYESLNNTDFVFLCVPTPMADDGSINDSILLSCLDELVRVGYTGVVVVKSTITPAVIEKIKVYNTLNLVYNPEFLRERYALADSLNPDFMVFGQEIPVGKIYLRSPALFHFYNDYTLINMPDKIFYVDLEEASMIKYSINCFLAMKVLFFNGIKDLCDNANLDYDCVAEAISSDPRIGPSHTQVPGPDGRKGFGGACFAKDTSALAAYARSVGIPFELLEETIRVNNKIRSQYDTLDPREAEQNVKF